MADLIPLLRMISGACDPDDDDHARRDQRGENDDVEVDDEVICPSNKTIVNTSRRRCLATSLTHALHSHSTIHAIGMMRSRERSSTERRRSNVANGLKSKRCRPREVIER